MAKDQEYWIYEDDLPEDFTDEEYDEWFKDSRLVLGVRMGPGTKKAAPNPYGITEVEILTGKPVL